MNRRWQKKRAHATHTDDWLMTYADMITLLLCFFAIIIMTSVIKKHVQPLPPPAVEQRQQIPAPLPQPVVQAETPRPFDIFPGNLPFHPIDQADEPETLALPIKTAETSPLIVVQAPIPVPVPSAEYLPPIIKTPIPAKVEQKGDRLTVIEMPSAAFFDSGSATLSMDGKSILRDVAASLKSDQYRNYRITVEGHTDDTPIHTAQFPSNWELSTARASSVVHYFLDQGIPALRLRAAGYADTFSKVPNRDSSGNPVPANRAENRRVVIKLEKIDSD